MKTAPCHAGRIHEVTLSHTKKYFPQYLNEPPQDFCVTEQVAQISQALLAELVFASCKFESDLNHQRFDQPAARKILTNKGIELFERRRVELTVSDQGVSNRVLERFHAKFIGKHLHCSERDLGFDIDLTRVDPAEKVVECLATFLFQYHFIGASFWKRRGQAFFKVWAAAGEQCVKTLGLALLPNEYLDAL
jgi:hypothetical protein